MTGSPRAADAAVVQAYLAALSAAGYTVTALVWYGSRAQGTATDPRSDFDLIVVAPEFAGRSWVERISAAYAHWPASHAADILCYTPAEFERLAQRASIVREAIQTGRVVGR